MSERNEQNLEKTVPDTVENKEIMEEVAENLQPAEEERENAPRSEVKPEKEKPAVRKKGKKKRKKAAALLALIVILMLIALVFGMVVGYTIGRNAGTERVSEMQTQIDMLEQSLETEQDTPAYNAFDEEISGENQEALMDLAGEAFANEGEDASILMGEDEFGVVGQGSSEEAVVVAEFKGGKVMSDEAAREYSEQMTSLVFSGYNEEEVAEILLNEVLRYMVSDRILEAHAREMGLYELTDEDRAQIEVEAQHNYDEQLEFYKDFVNTENMSEEEASGAVKAYVQENVGTTLDTIREELESGWWANKMYNHIVADVEVDDADVQAAYDALLAEQQEIFSVYPDDFEFAQMNGETIVFNLDGYRAVRMLLFGFGSADAYEAVSVLTDDISEMDPAVNAEDIDEMQAQIDSFYATPEIRAQEALEALNNGADFEQMLISEGEDAGMLDERLRASGYYVSAESLLWPEEMVAAAMKLENPGDLSAAVRMPNGVCILQYVGEVPAGAVAMEDVRDVLQAQTLEDAQYAAYEEQLNEWLEDADVVYYPERMQ